MIELAKIVFKEPQFEEEFKKLSLVFQKMIGTAAFLAMQICDEPSLLVTSIYRPPVDEKSRNSVHAYYRGIDFSINALKGHANSAQRIRDMMNHIYFYNPQEPDKQCIPTLYHGSAPHIHLQIHPNTTTLSRIYADQIARVLEFDEAHYKGLI